VKQSGSSRRLQKLYHPRPSTQECVRHESAEIFARLEETKALPPRPA
jgi:hypothetical protein